MADRPTLSRPSGDRLQVEMYDRVFEIRPVTRSVAKALSGVQKDLAGIAESDPDALVHAMCNGVDTLLAPTNGQKITAGKLLRDQWDSDELALDDLVEFFQELQQANSRPT